MSNQKHSGTRIYKTILYSTIAVLLTSAFVTLIILNPSSSNLVAIIVTIVTAFSAILASLDLILSDNKFLKRKPVKQGQRREPTVTTSDISTRFRLKAGEEASDELLTVEKQRLELEKQKIQLEREQQTIGWQKEALALVQVSPRAAIVIAWIGVEQEMNRIARRSYQLIQPGTHIANPLLIINALNEAGYINQHELETLKRMQAVRNRVVHAVEESVPSTEDAISYIQDAINITQKLASIEE